MPTSDLNTSAKGSNQNAEKVSSRYVVASHITQQPNKESNWNLQVAVAESTKGERMRVHSLIDVSHDPLDDRMPSPHDLLLGCKPQTTLPGRKSILKYKHPDNDIHHKANQRRQQRQAVFYDRKAGSDKRPLSNQEPVFHVEHLEGYLAAGNCAK